MMKSTLQRGVKFLAVLLMAFILGTSVAADSSAATISMQAYMQFEKLLGIREAQMISYGDLDLVRNQKIIISPAGDITTVDGQKLGSLGSHPGKIVIDDGHHQQFSLMAGQYMSTSAIRPISALCNTGKGADTSCDKIESAKGAEDRVINLGMMIQVLDPESRSYMDPQFDLSVVYH